MKIDYDKFKLWESGLLVGDKVEARWTNCSRNYRGQAQVIRINRASIGVALIERVESQLGGLGYPTGHEILCCSTGDPRRWSINNCVLPLDITLVATHANEPHEEPWTRISTQ